MGIKAEIIGRIQSCEAMLADRQNAGKQYGMKDCDGV